MSTRSATWTGRVCKSHQLLLRAYKLYLLFQKNLKMLWTITMFLRELTSSAICACSALEHHNMDMEIFSSWGLRSLPAASAEIVSAVNHNHLSLSTDACFTFSFLIFYICLTHCYTCMYIFQEKRKQKNKIILWSRSLITADLYKSPNIYISLTVPCLDLRIYCKYNYCDSHTSYNPFCSLTKLQLLLLFRDFEKIFPFVNRNFISLYTVLASSDYFQFRQCCEKNALIKESFLSLDTLREFWHLAIHHYSPCMGPGKEMRWAFMRNHGNPDG